jgi:copper(I)-binding protein
LVYGDTNSSSSTATTAPSRKVLISAQLAQMPVPFAGVEQAPIYLTLINNSDEQVVLVGASSEAAQKVEFVDTASKVLQQLIIPAHEQLQLQKTTNHLLLKGLKHSIRSGEQLHLQLKFKNAPPLEVTVTAISSYDQPHH